jgi:hypothetical protein
MLLVQALNSRLCPREPGDVNATSPEVVEFYRTSRGVLYCGDAKIVLAAAPDESVDCIVGRWRSGQSRLSLPDPKLWSRMIGNCPARQCRYGLGPKLGLNFRALRVSTAV